METNQASVAAVRTRRFAAPRRVSPALNRFRVALVLLLFTACIGTAGYVLLEGWPFLDALYMTVITLGTIGYGETNRLDTSGRIFTMILIVTSLGIVGYALSTMAAFIVEGEFNKLMEGRRMDKRLAGLSNHVILCGGGHTGKSIAEELHKTGTPFVVIERSAEHIRHLRHIGEIPSLEGDATEDETLLLAGIDRARGLVTALDDDKDNVFVVLTARSLKPELRIVSRLIEEGNAEKLRKAGADEIVSPNAIGGMRMASVMIRPQVVTFLDSMLRVAGPTIRVEEIALAAGSPLAGRTLAEAEIARRTGLLVLAFKPRDGALVFNPAGATALQTGDVLIVMGSREQMDALRKLAGA